MHTIALVKNIRNAQNDFLNLRKRKKSSPLINLNQMDNKVGSFSLKGRVDP
jgi:hypothetical protein